MTAPTQGNKRNSSEELSQKLATQGVTRVGILFFSEDTPEIQSFQSLPSIGRTLAAEPYPRGAVNTTSVTS